MEDLQMAQPIARGPSDGTRVFDAGVSGLRIRRSDPYGRSYPDCADVDGGDWRPGSAASDPSAGDPMPSGPPGALQLVVANGCQGVDGRRDTVPGRDRGLTGAQAFLGEAQVTGECARRQRRMPSWPFTRK
jgi:hypothetical protein